MPALFSDFRGKQKMLLLVFLELVFAVLAVVSFLNLMGFNVFEVLMTRKYSFSLSHNIFDYFVFALSLCLLLIVYFAIKRKIPFLFTAQNKAFSEIKITAKQKVAHAKQDPRAWALVLLEFLFVFVIFVSATAFFDPEWELIPWSAAGLKDPYVTIINAIIAVLVLIGFYWLYSQTADYRHNQVPAKAEKSQKPKK